MNSLTVRKNQRASKYHYKRKIANYIFILNRYIPNFRSYYTYYTFAVLPTVLIALYFIFFASYKYEITSSAIIKNNKSQNYNSSNISLLSGVSDDFQRDALIITDYINSYDMLNHLDKTLNLRKHYESKDLDLISRMPKNEYKEKFLLYYRKNVNVIYDELSSIIHITVIDHDKDFAMQMQNEILSQSELFINNISKFLAEKQLGFIKDEVNNAKEQLQLAKANLKSFQDKYTMISPAAETNSIGSVINTMEADLIKEEANLKNLTTYLNANSHQVISTKNKIDVLQKQIASERKKLVGNSGKPLNEITSEFEKLQFEVEFLAENYKLSLTSLEKARVEAMQQIKHLMLIAKPEMPDRALYPKIIIYIIASFLLISMMYGIVKMIFATIKDHIDT